MGLAFPLAWPLNSKGLPIAPTRIALALKQVTRSGGQSYTGAEQTVTSPAGRWEGQMTFPHMDRGTLLNWRGFVAAMQGRLGLALVPVFEAGRQPWPSDSFGRRLTPAVARSARLRGTAYAIDPALVPAISIKCAAPAALNAVSLVLAPSVSGPIQAGHRFSLGGSLYEIMQAASNADGTVSVAIRPWLRSAVAANTICEFASPICAMRFKTDDEGALDLEGNRFANPTVNLVEAFS